MKVWDVIGNGYGETPPVEIGWKSRGGIYAEKKEFRDDACAEGCVLGD